MDAIVEKIKEFLDKNPNSKARAICKEIGAEKKTVNSCLYANLGSHFLKEGLTPPLWRNIGDFSKTEAVEIEILAFDENDAGEDLEFEIEDGDESIDEAEDESKEWTRLNAEDQQIYLKLNAYIAQGKILSRPDRRLMNQFSEKIRQLERSETRSVEKQEQKAKNRAEYAAKVNEKVDEMWSADEQRSHAIEALTIQFESYLRKLAYGYLISRNERLFEQETENEIEIRQAKGREQVEAVSSSIDTRLSNLESIADEVLVSSAVRFAWISRGRTSRPQAKNTIEMFPQFEENDEVKIYRSRFLGVLQRIKRA